MFQVNVNGKEHKIDVEAEMPLLWVLRDELGLTGTKYGCGVGQCGACTVLKDGEPFRSCSIQIGDVGAATITTIEGLSLNGDHPVQEAWQAENVPQCGYCQSGQILAAVALLARSPRPTDRQINEQMTNICRCGTYTRVRRAIHRAANGTAG
jgi:isoquinoline 1-oxidoreductase alpha subunit